MDSLEGSETSGPSLWTSYYYRCYTDDAEHHYIRHKVTDVIDIMTCATCPHPYFLKSTTTHHSKIHLVWVMIHRGGWEQFQNTHLRDCILPRCMFCRGVRNVVLTEHLSTVQFTMTLHLYLLTHFNLQHLHLHISWISDSDGMFGTFHLVGWIANCHIT